jgi:hypothetical protein
MKTGDANDILRERGPEGVASAFDAAEEIKFGAQRDRADDEPPDPGVPPIDDDEPPLIFRPTPFEPRDPSKFPRRVFLYGSHYVRKYVSATIAPGGVGKSSLVLVEAIAMASGRPLLGVHVKQALNVWYWNGEDPRDEIERRTLAICKHYKIDQEALTRRFFFDSGRDLKLIVAEMAGRGIKIAFPVKDALIAALKRREIDVLVIDPFVKAHRITENDNVFMDAVATVFAEIANDANCAVELVHHTRKTGGHEVTFEDARGASSVGAATRQARTLNGMAKDATGAAGIDSGDHWRFFRADTAKTILAPPEKAVWFKLASVGLGNFGPDPDDDEDHVGVVEPWQWPDAFFGVTVNDLRQVQSSVARQPRRKDVRSPDWIGYLILDVLKLDPSSKENKGKAAKIFDRWLESRMFKVVYGVDRKGNSREFVEVDQWADD